MELEASLKHFSPQGMHISDDVKGTSPDRITGNRCFWRPLVPPAAERVWSGSLLWEDRDQQKVMSNWLYRLWRVTQWNQRHGNVRKGSSRRVLAGACWCLAQFAFAEYSRSAETSVTCSQLQWYRADNKRAGSPVRFRTPWGKAPYWASRSRAVRPSDWEQWTDVTEIVPAVCDACEGKGTIRPRLSVVGVKEKFSTEKPQASSARRCLKPASAAAENGFSAVPSTAAYKVILKRVPDLHVRTWTRNWKPFLEALVSICQQGGGKRRKRISSCNQFRAKKVTKFSIITT